MFGDEDKDDVSVTINVSLGDVLEVKGLDDVNEEVFRAQSALSEAKDSLDRDDFEGLEDDLSECIRRAEMALINLIIFKNVKNKEGKE